MPPVRRLTAILAADAAGYSRLMGADEEGTHERLQAHFRELVNPNISEHRGRIVKNTGDGFLAEFPSVVDGVRCAVEIQRGMAEREPEVSEERRIEFRIGINLGDVIAEGEDIFGDGVNVAARLEALAEPGGICVSRVVWDQVRGRLDYTFEDLGDQHVKNIARPVRVYRVGDRAIPTEERAGGAERRRRYRAGVAGRRGCPHVWPPDNRSDDLGDADPLRARPGIVDKAIDPTEPSHGLFDRFGGKAIPVLRYRCCGWLFVADVSILETGTYG